MALSGEKLLTFLPGFHILVLGLLTGMVFHTTFINGLIQFKHLPKHMFGNLQSKQFPPYFLLQTIFSAILIPTSCHLHGLSFIEFLPRFVKAMERPADMNLGDFALNGLVLGLCSGLINLVYLGPETTRIMFDRHKLEKAGKEVPSSINSLFAWLHGIGSLLNLLTLAGAVLCSIWTGSLIKL
ncbi:hypothetical protein BDK51DRAFT_27196 [Blyttiomyces helicus]|uniref:TMEM205-like domain-containing protein n=1 Tax=Blyttiomyces helicus TaxID=388810 RepID=A0A4P9W786_9FUNG|nr:hypothetical protein BDK51DRAFT_27196 [Blyttiomyces helicus]|eukprot:RKO88214.1 hypothetical protein BDK51DRAFT_27196 [Blyttiomyces helicus]